MTRRVLIVCYYFPPLGLAGVTRPLQLFKRLANYGWECHVLTVKPVAYYAYEPELLEGLDRTKIHRAGSRDPARLMHLCGIRTVSSHSASATERIRSSVFPDSKRGWIQPAVRLGLNLIKEHQFDFLLSTSPPVSTHVVARHLAEETGVRWVADFRDLWTTSSLEESYDNPDTIARGIRLLADIRQQAAAMTAVNQSVATYTGSSTVITNGFDPDISRKWSAGSDRSFFGIGLLGTFDKKLPVEPLLQCLADLRDKPTSVFNRIRLIQVGRVDHRWFNEELKRFGLEASCSLHGLQSRERSIEILNACSLFYLGVTPGWGDRITTARVYDLLASGRPILAYAGPGSELAGLLSGANRSRAFSDSDIPAATAFIEQLASDHAGGGARFEPISNYARQYSWNEVAVRFATLFDRLG